MISATSEPLGTHCAANPQYSPVGMELVDDAVGYFPWKRWSHLNLDPFCTGFKMNFARGSPCLSWCLYMELKKSNLLVGCKFRPQLSPPFTHTEWRFQVGFRHFVDNNKRTCEKYVIKVEKKKKQHCMLLLRAW